MVRVRVPAAHAVALEQSRFSGQGECGGWGEQGLGKENHGTTAVRRGGGANAVSCSAATKGMTVLPEPQVGCVDARFAC